MPFIGIADRDAVIRKGPQLFNQTIIQLFFPFPRQERLRFLPVGGEFCTVAPLGIQRIGQRNFRRIAAVPAIFCQPDFFNSAFTCEGR
jgi:glutathione synthase/RimK-type ligase-like ATP-grasp enzyme